jgi:hypothetical protein
MKDTSTYLKMLLTVRRNELVASIGIVALLLLLVATLRISGPAVAHGETFDDSRMVDSDTDKTIQPHLHLTLKRDVFDWDSILGTSTVVQQNHDADTPRTVGTWKLQAIFYGEVPRAIINGRIYREGDTIGEATIRQIMESSVSIENSDGVVTLNLR